MNLTTTGSISTWKRLKMQYLFGAAGVALAVSGAIAVNSRGASAPLSFAGPALTSMPTWDRRPVGQQVVYVLAGSQEQAELVRHGEQIAAGERQSAGMPDPGARIVVLTPSTEQDVLAIRAAVTNAGQEDPSGTTYEIVDLRGR
jgi:hypothetical protein